MRWRGWHGRRAAEWRGPDPSCLDSSKCAHCPLAMPIWSRPTCGARRELEVRRCELLSRTSGVAGRQPGHRQAEHPLPTLRGQVFLRAERRYQPRSMAEPQMVKVFTRPAAVKRWRKAQLVRAFRIRSHHLQLDGTLPQFTSRLVPRTPPLRCSLLRTHLARGPHPLPDVFAGNRPDLGELRLSSVSSRSWGEQKPQRRTAPERQQPSGCVPAARSADPPLPWHCIHARSGTLFFVPG